MSASKLKIQGKELNKHFTNCAIPNTITDGRLMAINNQYLIMAWDCDYPGYINMVDSNNPCNLNEISTTFSIESSNILDMEFSPFYSNIFYFSNENRKIYMTKIKQNEIQSEFYNCHTNKVYFIDSNPVASNVICSSTSFGEIHIWDSVKFQTQYNFKASNNINTIHWNPKGSLIGYSTTNRLLTIIDPRSSTEIFQEQITDMNVKTRFVWLNDYSLANIGYQKKDKQFYLNLYDIRQTIKNPFSSINISSYGSSLTPFVDPELNLIYITAKDDYYIKIYDYSNGFIQKYGEYRATETNSFSLQLDRKYLNRKDQEIDRFARYTKNNKLFYISFILKNSNLNNEMLYPSEESYYPKMTFDEWFDGGEVIPQKVHSNNNYNKNNYNNINKNNKNNYNINNYNNNSSNNNNSNNNNYNNKHTGNSKINSENQYQNYISNYNKNLQNKYGKNPSQTKNNNDSANNRNTPYTYNPKEPNDSFSNKSKNKVSGNIEKNENEKLKNEVENLKKLIDEKDIKLKEYESDNSNLKKLLEMEKSKYNALEKNSNNSNKRNDLIYQSKNNKISSYAEQNKNRKNSKSDKENDILKNIELLKNQLGKAKETEKKLNEEINSKIELIKSKENKISELEKEKQNFENLIQSKEEIIKKQIISLDEQKSKISSLTFDNNKYLNQEKKLNEAKEEIIKNKKIINQNKIELEKINKLNEELSNLYENEKKNNDSLTSENNRNNASIEYYENEKKKQEENNNKLKQKHQEEINNLNKEKNDLENKIKEISDL